MSEKGQSVIELHEVPAGIMDVLLDFVYTETVNVGVENVQELLPAACLLQLTGQYPEWGNSSNSTHSSCIIILQYHFKENSNFCNCPWL